MLDGVELMAMTTENMSKLAYTSAAEPAPAADRLAGMFGIEFHGASTALVSTGTIQVLQFILIALGFAGSIHIAYRIAQSNYLYSKVWATITPFAVSMVNLTAMNVFLFTLPMAMRM